MTNPPQGRMFIMSSSRSGAVITKCGGVEVEDGSGLCSGFTCPDYSDGCLSA